MWVLYREHLSLKYCSSGIFSIAFLVNWFIIKVALTIPIVVIYKSGGLWQKLDTAIEQPDIKFKHDLFLIMQFDHQNYFWTNQPDLKIDAEFLKIPSIDNIEYDHNDDNLNDELKLELNIRASNENRLKSLRCIMAFDFKVKKAAHLEMEGLIDVKIDTNGDHNHIVHRNAIAFRQRELVSANGRTILGRAFDLERIMNDVDAFVADYSRGNYTIDLVNRQTEFKRDDRRNRYRFQLLLDYPPVVLRIKPKVWTELKYAWIQYLAIFAVVYLVVEQVRRFIFEDQLVQTDVVVSENLAKVQRHFAKKA